MTNSLQITDVQRVAQSLRRADAATRADLIANEVIETGGTYTEPKGDCSHVFEIHLHGILASGFSEDEAIQNWLCVADRTMRALSLGAQA
ncbi:hypothetical protein [Roseovarius sp. MMSF_3281]|uniref:hypothetical protein n=1 Tax=Roseovarius sp. MMSF_3281 TaxID=3046694 RepID=UPI00273D771E|nr:hypothetical protein [Roseovarius sp. MMSF_3281]